MKNCQLSVLGVIAFMVSAGHGYAHPGHALNEHGVSHIVTSPFHVAMLLALALGCWSAAWFVRHTMSRCVLRLGAAVAVSGAAILWSLMA